MYGEIFIQTTASGIETTEICVEHPGRGGNNSGLPLDRIVGLPGQIFAQFEETFITCG